MNDNYENWCCPLTEDGYCSHPLIACTRSCKTDCPVYKEILGTDGDFCHRERKEVRDG